MIIHVNLQPHKPQVATSTPSQARDGSLTTNGCLCRCTSLSACRTQLPHPRPPRHRGHPSAASSPRSNVVSSTCLVHEYRRLRYFFTFPPSVPLPIGTTQPTRPRRPLTACSCIQLPPPPARAQPGDHALITGLTDDRRAERQKTCSFTHSLTHSPTLRRIT